MTEWSRLKPTVGGTIRQIDIYGDKGKYPLRISDAFNLILRIFS